MVLRLPPVVAPVQVAVLPLSKKLNDDARLLYERLRRAYRCEFDDGGSIGKRYRRQDEIGTPFCVTVDFETLEDKAVTVRDRDAMTQERVPLESLDRVLMDRVFA